MENGSCRNFRDKQARGTTLVFSRLLDLGEQSHVPGVLDRGGELTLILGTGAGHRARSDLSIGRDELREGFHVFVIDVLDVVLLEVADLPARTDFLISHCLGPFFLGVSEGEIAFEDVAVIVLLGVCLVGQDRIGGGLIGHIAAI